MTLDKCDLAERNHQPTRAGARRRPVDAARSGRSFDEALFRAWQSGDEGARERIWSLLYRELYTMAVGFCRKLGHPSTAADNATEAFLRTLGELDPRSNSGSSPVEWRGERSFVAYVRHRLVLRCRDVLRQERAAANRLVAFSEDDDESQTVAHRARVPADQSERVRGELSLRVVLQVEACRRACRGRRSLEGVVDAIEAYVRDRLVAAAVRSTENAAALAACTLRELAERAVPERIEITRDAMYRFVRARLGMAAPAQRNAFYLRMRELRVVAGAGTAV